MAWLTMAQSIRFMSMKTILYLERYSSITRPMFFRDRVPPHPRGNPQDPPLEHLTTGLIEHQERDLLPILKIVDTTSKLALSLFTIFPARTQREGGLLLIYV